MSASISRMQSAVFRRCCGYCNYHLVGPTGNVPTRHASQITRPPRKKTKSDATRTKSFVDVKRVRAFGGNGGDGCLSFLRLPRKEWAGPDGGDGGSGGHVIFRASESARSLAGVKTLQQASHGVNGRGDCCHGKNAEHTIVDVPLGTLCKTEDGQTVADLTKPGDMYIAVRGGAGGKGNHFFLTNETRAPMVYEEGGRGEEKLLYLELRIMAHAGLIGFPNVGKSTLLRAISRARPKVAGYPFTTVRPHVGIVEYSDHEQLAVADLPGLIVGAHLNYGMGASFLRHIERCLWLLYVVDLSYEEPWTQLEALQEELDLYRPGLSQRPHAIIANKLDVDGARENLQELQQRVHSPVFGVSAQQGLHIRPLLAHLRELYDQYQQEIS